MQQRIINPQDLAFQLFELHRTEDVLNYDRYADHSLETLQAALDLALKVAAEEFAPHARLVDEEEPTFESGRVTMRPEVKKALDVLRETGLMAAGQSYERGGMQLPAAVAQMCVGMLKGANVGTQGYAGLTIAAANLILAHGSEEQKQRYADHMLAGRFFGTMCLTEPHAGSSLGDLRTRAEPQDDGSYRLKGNKIYISAGDHELSENIIHMVLARLPDAPPGVKGISLFLVPKSLVNEDGSLGERNDVALAGLIHKMGYRGTTSTMLNFGEKDGAVGYLVGEPHKGLAAMFHMMNEARIGVGLGAVMLGYTGYLHALEYARERRQGRPMGEKDPATPQVPLIRHADIRRMLLTQKAYVEGGLALCLEGARLVDEKKFAASDTERAEAAGVLDLLTPLIKSWPSQFCLEANSLAIQVHGGYGYTREYPVEQFYRDNRLNPIHEGTHGIQGLDLLGRKVIMANGEYYNALMGRIRRTIKEAREVAELKDSAERLQVAIEQMAQATDAINKVRASGETERALANASLYLEAFGHTVVGWLWLRQAQVALQGIANSGPQTEEFYRGKLKACDYFARYELPRVASLAGLLAEVDGTALNIADAEF
ncbi:acyl-CoA dehydrogenase [Marinobacter nanhaiticus D15-8W]|uniref:3-methylmercaptopropionyl-CoA dehydrogenase n=1 Tax=Marinobacter nanhaiticus D15-8W TaxID=626887 RepID=N6WV33_9GAMM|nr:acyl-CoA dehydrogenase [Marinobacter nanhaiticus]ENO14887.1 acyl-CoA dehydrogenase [Marinobacter nanhaiticus D15-8W]BES69417.1 acyl-CoA dehydrogenase [Marinobacter nanhaiticus D15-8W]